MKNKNNKFDVIGTPGIVLFNGEVEYNELNPELNNRNSRYRLYSDTLANVSIVSAGVRFFINLVSKANWIFNPSEDDRDGKFAKLAEEMLTVDPITPWHRIVRRAAMYRMYGFSIQEWVAKRRDDGVITFLDVMSRPQSTIEKWDIDKNGFIKGILQESPDDYSLKYIPRPKVLYLVDDALNDTPEGLGLFRHFVEPSNSLRRYIQIEGLGFELSVSGIPVAGMPIAEIQEQVSNGQITEGEAHELIEPFKQFMDSRSRNERTGMFFDSQPYKSEDGSISSKDKWFLKLIQGSGAGSNELASAIKRFNHDIAMILGVDQLLLGADGGGSLALSRDKTDSFLLMVDSVLKELSEAVKSDLIDTIWEINNFNDDLKPKIEIESLQQGDPEKASIVLKNLAVAALENEDAAIDSLRERVGVPTRSKKIIDEMEKLEESDSNLFD
ncbi:MAG: hypothetical protein V3T09_08360 [bacterium]